MSKNIFITGTDTDVGKTYVTGLILKKLCKAGIDAAYFKAAASGNERDADGALVPMDAKIVQDMSGIKGALCDMVPYVYERAVSPHLASRIEGNVVDMRVVTQYYERLSAQHEYITMEGSGGILCPIVAQESELWLEDIIKAFDMPCIIVAHAGLGTINHTVLTGEYMRQKGIAIAGVIINDYLEGDVMIEDNIAMIAKRLAVPILARVKRGDTELDMDACLLAGLYRESGASE